MAKIIVAESASEDLNRVAEYIALVNQRAAKNLVERVLNSLSLLEENPKLGSFPLEFKQKTYRHLIEPPVRVFYRIEGDTVLVVHIYRMEMNIQLEDIRR